jgi:hypothetical protein
MKAKYLDPFTNFGFKRLFRQEASKPLLHDYNYTPLNYQLAVPFSIRYALAVAEYLCGLTTGCMTAGSIDTNSAFERARTALWVSLQKHLALV